MLVLTARGPVHAGAETQGLYAAGEKMGKGGQVGGYYHYHKVLFQKSIRITARSLTKVWSETPTFETLAAVPAR